MLQMGASLYYTLHPIVFMVNILNDINTATEWNETPEKKIVHQE